MQRTIPDNKISPTPLTNLDVLLQQGEAAACARELQEARRCFETMLQTDPGHIEALLWMAWLAGGGQASLRYLAHALRIDPANQRAREAIRWARKQQNSPNVAPTPAPKKAHRPRKKRSVARRHFFALGGLAAVLLVLLTGLAFVEQPRPTSAIALLTPAASQAPDQPSASTTLRLWPTWTASPTPTSCRRVGDSSMHEATSLPTRPSTLTPTSTAGFTPTPTPLPTMKIGKNFRWIDVDLGRQVLIAYEGTRPVREIVVSTGLSNTPTVTGRFRIYAKYPAARMQGADYDLPNVPWVMYFYGSYGIHGTYWHTNFGQPASHGCVNLPKSEAEWLYEWADIGTLVNVHY